MAQASANRNAYQSFAAAPALASRNARLSVPVRRVGTGVADKFVAISVLTLLALLILIGLIIVG